MKYIIAIILALSALDASAAGIKKINGVTFAYTSSVNGVDLADIASIDGQAPVLELLCGTVVAPNSVIGKNKVSLSDCDALKSGTIIKLRGNTGAVGNIKTVVYDDVAGQPTNLLAANGPFATAGGDIWEYHTLSTYIQVTASTTYWIGANIDTDGAIRLRTSASGIAHKNKLSTYSTYTAADPETGGWSDYANLAMSLVGYGYAE